MPAPFDGLGVIANYTLINSGSDFVSQKTNASYSVPGLSDNTVNFTVFYEKGPWSGRVSHNFRDEFLDNIGVAWQPHPTFVEPYSQLDAAFGYAPNDRLKFAFEAINLTDENVYYYHRLGTGTQDHFAGRDQRRTPVPVRGALQAVASRTIGIHQTATLRPSCRNAAV